LLLLRFDSNISSLIKAPDGSAIVSVDGPFGAASEEIFDAKIAVLIGAGTSIFWCILASECSLLNIIAPRYWCDAVRFRLAEHPVAHATRSDKRRSIGVCSMGLPVIALPHVSALDSDSESVLFLDHARQVGL